MTNNTTPTITETEARIINKIRELRRASKKVNCVMTLPQNYTLSDIDTATSELSGIITCENSKRINL